MNYLDTLAFASLLLLVCISGRAIHSWVTRTGLFCLFSLLILVICDLFVREANGVAVSVANGVGLVVSASLTMLGLSAPVRFFGAFRVLGVVLFLRLLTGALLTSNVPDRDDAWFATAAIGLPCLWFAWKARAAPSRQAFHVILEEASLPTFGQLQDFLDGAGYDLSIQGSPDVRDHTGNLPVIFSGAPTEFQFNVNSLAQFMAVARMPDSLEKQLGDNRISATFRYRDDLERMAALVAAAALTKLTGGQLFDAAQEHWLDADDAIDTAQDVVQPLELHVLLHDANIPTSEQWQNALTDSGLALAQWDSFDVRTHTGFLPVAVQGIASGFAFALDPPEFVVGSEIFANEELPEEAAGMNVSANFRFADGDHVFAAPVAAAILARLADGFVYNPRTTTFSRGEAALEAAREAICERFKF